MLLAAVRGLLAHAFPILIAQLSSIGMMVVDTAVLGHVSPLDLAAVAIGGGIHISVVFALVGILQAVAPLVAHLHGARRDGEVAGVLQQGFWLALLLSVPGVLFLTHPGAVLGMAGMEAAVESKVRLYLAMLAWSLPASLCYRTFYAFCNALGRPRVLMVIGLAALPLHAVLAWGFALQGWLGEALGVAGCALSNIVIAWVACLAAGAYLAYGPLGVRYRPFSDWKKPDGKTWRELLRLGLPMGFSNLVEITAFTLIALFVAPLGAEIVAGHRIVANLAALCYMLPLSLAIATLSAVGQAVGARDWPRAHAVIGAGLLLAAGLSTLLGGLLWLAAAPLVAAYTDDPGVRAVAMSLVAYIALYQFFDALQTVAGHVLRAYRVTFVPMLIQTFCFWGVGLWGGWWLCYHASPPLGIDGFWLGSVASLVCAALLLGPLLWQAVRGTESAP
ncbi:MATE family efflux transporter [Quatrionicoccus australiensis]|uniref:MATE family efflux transporter n=1 Tax=Quatrionicoccus australiensis TaxID=138118 RepID=UPI001CFB2BFC|nr:MATE family efflux transporter [Quatrionicoccus australiensis]MCB4360801.1 MATE family efflux transporter [Quatrionicoccus australiensis]